MNNFSRLFYSLDGNFSVRRKSSVYVTWFPAYCLAILNLKPVTGKTRDDLSRQVIKNLNRNLSKIIFQQEFLEVLRRYEKRLSLLYFFRFPTQMYFLDILKVFVDNPQAIWTSDWSRSDRCARCTFFVFALSFANSRGSSIRILSPGHIRTVPKMTKTGAIFISLA